MDRRLAALLVADVVGYSRLMGADEAGTLAALKERRRSVLEPSVKEHRGRIVKVMGDGVLVEFKSAVNAVACALALQERMAGANAGLPEERRIVLRIGINLGDVIGEGADVYGDGVNLAARLEALAEPGGICLSGKVHDEVLGKLPFAAVDGGEVAVKNISRPVRVYRIVAGVAQAALPPPARERSGSDRPSVAVLPFDNLTGDPAQQYLSDGITEDILTALSRFRHVSVMARHASFQLARSAGGPVQAAKALGLRHVVEGSVRRTPKGFRITVQLIDVRDGDHLWAGTYDRNAEDMLAVQDEVVEAVAATLEGRIASVGSASARLKPAASWSAYDLLLRGRELCNSSREVEAIGLFERAIALDPDFAAAHGWLGLAQALAFFSDSQPGRLQLGARSAQRALALDNSDPIIHWAVAMNALLLREHDRAGRHFDRAIALNPSDTMIRADRAYWLRFSDRPVEALAAIDDAFRRDQIPPPWFSLVRGHILFDLGRYAEVVETLDGVGPESYTGQLYSAAALAHLGRREAAKALLDEVRKGYPPFTLRDIAAVTPHVNRQKVEDLLATLRDLGVPE